MFHEIDAAFGLGKATLAVMISVRVHGWCHTSESGQLGGKPQPPLCFQLLEKPYFLGERLCNPTPIRIKEKMFSHPQVTWYGLLLAPNKCFLLNLLIIMHGQGCPISWFSRNREWKFLVLFGVQRGNDGQRFGVLRPFPATNCTAKGAFG